MTNTMFTAQVVAATGPNANPRLAQIMPSFLLHLHNFVREANITIPEFMAAIKLVRYYFVTRKNGKSRFYADSEFRSFRSTRVVKCPTGGTRYNFSVTFSA